jgi:hypothetical protein
MARLLTKTIILFATLSLVACSTTVPVKRTFPEVPEQLMAPCESLSAIGKPEVTLSELMTTVTKNYTRYHSCAEATSAWQQWYQEQRAIFDSVE